MTTLCRLSAATLLLTGAIALSGCTGTTVKPSLTHQDARKTYSTVAVGQIAASDELWHNYTVEIQRELAAELIASKAFSQVLDSMPTAPPANAVMVSGVITQVARWSGGAPLPAGWSAWVPVAHT